MHSDPNHGYSHADEYQVMDYQHPDQFDITASPYNAYPGQPFNQHAPEQRAFFFPFIGGLAGGLLGSAFVLAEARDIMVLPGPQDLQDRLGQWDIMVRRVRLALLDRPDHLVIITATPIHCTIRKQKKERRTA